MHWMLQMSCWNSENEVIIDMASTGHQDQVEVERWTLDVRVLNGNVLADAGYIFLHNFPTGKSSETQNRTVKLSKNSSASRLSPSLKALAKRMWHFMSCIYSTAMQICTWYYISLSWLLIKIAHTKDYSSEPQNIPEKGSTGHSTVPLVQRKQYHAHRERHSRLATASKHHDGGSLDQSNTGLGKLYADRWVGSLTSDSSWTYRNAVQVLGRMVNMVTGEGVLVLIHILENATLKARDRSIGGLSPVADNLLLDWRIIRNSSLRIGIPYLQDR